MLLWIVHSGDHLNARARLCIEVHFREEHRSDWPIFGRGEVQPDSGRVARIRSDIEGALDPSRLLVLSLDPPSRVKTETNESLSTIYLSTRRTASTCALRRALSDIARGNNFGETRLASSASPNQILVANLHIHVSRRDRRRSLSGEHNCLEHTQSAWQPLALKLRMSLSVTGPWT